MNIYTVRIMLFLSNYSPSKRSEEGLILTINGIATEFQDYPLPPTCLNLPRLA